MVRALRTWASCWLAASALALVAVAEAAARECAAQECETEDNSLLSTRRLGSARPRNATTSQRLSAPAPSFDLPTYVAERNPEMHPVPPSKHTPADADDDVEVFWLTAPLGPVTELFGHGLLGQLAVNFFGLYHAGIGFRNTRTGLESDAQFYALGFGSNLIVPKVDSSNFSWTWNRTAILLFEEGHLNRTYWTGIETIATIKGSDYNRLVTDRIGDLTKETIPYVLFTLSLLDHEVSHQPHLHGVPAAPGLPPGSATCMDVAARVLLDLEEVAGSQVFDANKTVKRDDTYLWMRPGTRAVKLDLSGGHGSPDYDLALKYFSAMQGMLNDPSWSGRLEDLINVVGEDWVFTDIHNDYWRFTPNAGDWASYKESIVPPV